MENKNSISINLEVFREIYDLYYEPLCKFLLFYTKDTLVIEDIVQEVFLSLWEQRNSIKITYIKTYVFQSAKNKLLNHLRNEKNRSVLLEKWFQEQLQNQLLNKDSFEIEQVLKVVEKAIDNLPKKCQEIFVLSKTQNMTYKQISELKQISVKTVENQMGIALKKIRAFLSEYYPALLVILLPLFS